MPLEPGTPQHWLFRAGAHLALAKVPKPTEGLWEDLAFHAQQAAENVGVVSFTVEGYDPQEVATLLDASYGIEARSGLHCAPQVHAALGSELGGTVRLSLGPFTTAAELAAAVQAVREIAAATI